MRDIGVYVTVGKKSDKVHCRIVFKAVCNEVLPNFAFVHFAGSDAFVNKARALRINLSATESVVAYFTVTHIIIGRKTYGCAVSLNVSVRASFHELVKYGSVCVCNCVAVCFFVIADTVHNNENKRSVHFFPFEPQKRL